MANVLQILPEIEGNEQVYIQGIIKDMDDNKAHMFANAYRSRRKDPTTLLLLDLVGFLGIAGIHRFMINQIGMGVLYVLTGGLCGIGTIVDLFIVKRLAFEYNQQQAQQLAVMVRGT